MKRYRACLRLLLTFRVTCLMRDFQTLSIRGTLNWANYFRNLKDISKNFYIIMGKKVVIEIERTSTYVLRLSYRSWKQCSLNGINEIHLKLNSFVIFSKLINRYYARNISLKLAAKPKIANTEHKGSVERILKNPGLLWTFQTYE